MKKPLALFLFVAAAGALLAAGPAKPSASTYDVTVDTIEGCSCPLFCTCYFGPSADEHSCKANNVYKFRKGSHYGGVDLSDQIVWLDLDLGGEWHHHPGPGMPTKWAVVTFDKKSSEAQRKAIGEVLAVVFPVKWEKFSTREDSIEWHDDAKMSHAKMASGMAEISLDKTATMRPDKSQPVVVKNLQYWFSNANDGFVLAYSKHHWKGDNAFEQDHKNGFNITWTAKGDIKPAAKVAMK
jgi:uncharacterized protein DUF1326